MDFIIKPALCEIIEKGYGNIPYFGREILGMDFHEEQEEHLRAIPGHEEVAIATGNRWGKGEEVLALGGYIGMYKPVSRKFKTENIPILNTSISQDQANIVFDKFESRLTNKPRFSWAVSDVKKSPFPHIVLKTGVTWWFRNASQNGKFLEGRSYFWANFDEADLQPEFQKFLEDILWPRLWDYGGFLTWTTTPRQGKRNAYKEWQAMESSIRGGDTKKLLLRGDSRKNKFLHESAREKMDKLPERLLNKNVLGLFEDTEGVLTSEALEFCELVADGLRGEAEAGHRYINFWDFARSRTFNCGGTLEVGERLQLRSWERTQDPEKKDREYWQRIAHRVRERHRKWRGVTVIDATGLGDVLASFLSDIQPICIKLEGGATGLRAAIIEEGISVVQMAEIGLPLSEVAHTLNGVYWSLKDEMLNFEPSALQHIVWDFICSLFLGIWVARGKRTGPKSNGKKKAPPRVKPRVKGVPRHAVVR
jgi:hypothetical protein